MTLKRLGVISLLIIVGITFITYVVTAQQTKTKNKVLSNMDLRLEYVETAKTTARTVKNLISIRTPEDYKKYSREFKKIMTTSIHREYFPTEEYQGGEKYFTIKELNTSVDIQGRDEGRLVVKLELLIVEDSRETPITLLVYTENGIIYRIQSL